MEIRPAKDEDVEQVLALWGAARSEHAAASDSAEHVTVLRERDPEALLVAVEDRAVVGTLVVGWDGWRGNLYRLAVEPTHRRRGIGAALVRAGEERLRQLGAFRVSALVAGEHDPGARAFWDAAGYGRDPVMLRWVRYL